MKAKLIQIVWYVIVYELVLLTYETLTGKRVELW